MSTETVIKRRVAPAGICVQDIKPPITGIGGGSGNINNGMTGP